MGTISVSLPSDGTTADVSDYNTPITTIVNEINGSLDNANIASGAAIAGSKLADSSIDSDKYVDGSIDPEHLTTGAGTSWTGQSWTPTWTNLAVNTSTVTALYTQIGKTVHFRITVVLGGLNVPSGIVSFTLPVTSVTYAGTATTQPIGIASYNDGGSLVYDGRALWSSTTTARLVAIPTNGNWATYFNINATNPFTFTSGDEIFIQGSYEAA